MIRVKFVFIIRKNCLYRRTSEVDGITKYHGDHLLDLTRITVTFENKSTVLRILSLMQNTREKHVPAAMQLVDRIYAKREAKFESQISLLMSC